MAVKRLVHDDELKVSLLHVKLLCYGHVQHVYLYVVVQPHNDLVRSGLRSFIRVQDLLRDIRIDLRPFQQIYAHQVSLPKQSFQYLYNQITVV